MAQIFLSYGVIPVISVLSLAACAEKSASTPEPVVAAKTPAAPAPAPPPKPVPLDPPAAPTAGAALGAADASFESWKAAMRAEAVARGLRAETVDKALIGLTPNPRVIQLDRNQPDVKTSYAAYVGRRLTAARIAQGRRLRRDYAATLDAAERRYGVSADAMVGIWGMETSYGADMGSFDVIRSLASLAYDGRRSAMFRRELMAALTILDKGLARPDQLRGSWAGAMGHPQFMPSSYLDLGVDGDQDGRIDIWSNLTDVFSSMGNYLSQRGWKAGIPWGFQVVLPAGYDPSRYVPLNPPASCRRALEKHSALRPVGQWRADGLVPFAAGAAWPADEVLASVVRPDGDAGPAFLVTENYRAVLNYNCSNYYALSVLLLADQVGKPSPPMAHSQPVAAESSTGG